ncbi:penicillin-binding transpeptidase domain-containing protein [Hoeflea sp. YIM 152468]|uniref:penicillin-binding transpeptidase domain-containing protein n=1 Tax=Hoeflea sp. YIM 152468 TaxID=3031759 RepID=UPI0023DA5029|nr:penicillin-binding transpeptidase domain-containing protein [Hoeflea sp. YIM 152468]MDF1610328.1 penicillin-binding transpeptidase domain-containing protein [Hoeflea sp. YIM 152468]
MKARFLGALGFRAGVLSLLAGILYLGAYFFVDTFRVNRIWMDRVEIPSAVAFDATTFDFLVEGGAIWPIRDGVSVALGHAPCNTLALRAPETVNLVTGAAGEAGRKYVRELCESPQGERIREEVANFNQSYRIVSVSDNRQADDALNSAEGVACADGVSTAKLFVPPRCLPNKWEATIAADGRAVQSITTAAISQFDYAFLASETESFFGDWKVITPVIDTQTGEAGQYRFRTSMTFGDMPVSIRTIGAVRSIAVNGVRLAIDPATTPDDVRAVAGQKQAASLAIYCADDAAGTGRRQRCEGESPRGRPTGSLLSLSQPTGRTVEVEMVIEPSIRVARELRRYLTNTEKNTTKAGDGTVSLGFGRIRVGCQLSRFEIGAAATGRFDTGCDLSWNVPDNQKIESQAEPLTNLSLHGLPVLDSQGALTQKAFELGLGGLLGLGTGDSGSVAAALTLTEDGENPSLTILPDYQRKAIAALALNYKCPKDQDRCARRADLVILDAEGEDAGNVLAIASLPQPRTGLSSWDIETLELTAPSKSPLAAYGWRNYDLRGTPGSAFKLVTALAASQYVLDSGDKTLEDVLLGNASPLQIADLFGIVATRPSFNGRCKPNYDERDPEKLNALPIPGARGGIAFCMGNSASSAGIRSGISHILELGGDSGCGEARAPRAGLCEAIKKSSNLYFAGIALYLDADRLMDSESGFEHTNLVSDLLLAKTADRLFPGARNSDAVARKTALDLLDVNYPATGRGRSSPLIVEAGLPVPPGEPRRLRLARGGIGLSVSASPLAMASVAASVATGKIVRPHLVPKFQRGDTDDPLEGEPVLTAPSDKQTLVERLLTEIRSGMAAVVRNKGGTSRSAFAKIPAELRNAVYAKTGTAPVFTHGTAPEDGRYAAWLIGYVEPDGALPGIDQRIAFACRVAFSPTYGGSACGPVVRDFLMALYEGEK